jgi:hypothetical protein
VTKPYHGERRACKGCGRAIAFILDEKGTLQVLDVMTLVYKLEPDLAGDERAKIIEGAYISHFLTCPKANDFSASARKNRS